MRLQIRIVSLIVIVLAALSPVEAQSPPNLLTNPSFEPPYYALASSTQTVPQGWALWIGEGAPEALPGNDIPDAIDGRLTWNIRQHDATFTVAAYQPVTVKPGQTLEFSAWGWLFACGDVVSVCAIAEPPYQRSDVTAGATLRVGIDPTGNLDPLAQTVVWSPDAAPYDRWGALAVSATAQNEAITVFLFATQTTALARNDVFWDAATLVETVAAQVGLRPDGSLVHIAQSGDTLVSIANLYRAYGVTVDSITAINDEIFAGTSALTAGQEIVILPPGSLDPATGNRQDNTPTPEPAATATLAPAPAATATPTLVPLADAAPELAATTGALCVSAYDDVNQNAQRDDGETALMGAQVTVTGADPRPVTEDPLCMDLAPGTQRVALVPPVGYGLTTPETLAIRVLGGQQITVAFGAALGYMPPLFATPLTPVATVVDPRVGVIAPTVSAAEGARRSALDRLYNSSGLIFLMVAGIVAVGSLALLLVAYRVPRV
jgi:hypothetical protein